MKSPARTVVIIAVIVVVVAIAAWQAARALRPRNLRIESARITKFDPVTRKGEIEFVHPKSGRTMTVSGSVAESCTITINGAPATIADVQVGDVATVEGVVFATRTVEAHSVSIERSQPEAQPAAPADESEQP